MVVLDDLSTGFAENLDGVDVELVEGSILDVDLLEKVADGADAIVHLGARPSVPRSIADPVASHLANATGTVNVLEAARRQDAYVVVASSSSVYGATPTLPKREDLPTRPLSPYAASKLATEAYTNAYATSFGLETLALRFFNVFGPRQAAGHAYAAVVPAFVDAALAGRPVTIYGDGTQSRDFTYVDTVTAVLVDAVRRRLTDPEPMNLAFGTRTDLLTLVDLLEDELGHPVERRFEAPRPGDVPHSQADGSRLVAAFPDVVPVALAEGLAATVAWMRGGGLTSPTSGVADRRRGRPAQADATAGGGVAIGVHHAGDDVPLVEVPTGLGDGGRAHPRPPLGRAGEGGDRRAEGGGIAGRHEQPGDVVVDDLAAAADVGRDDRQARRRRLHRGSRLALAVGGEDEHVERAEQVGDVVAVTEERHAGGPGPLDDGGVERIGLVTVCAADDDETDAWSEARRRPRTAPGSPSRRRAARRCRRRPSRPWHPTRRATPAGVRPPADPGRKRVRSTPLPRWRTLARAARRKRRIVATSSTFCTSSACDQREAKASRA